MRSSKSRVIPTTVRRKGHAKPETRDKLARVYRRSYIVIMYQYTSTYSRTRTLVTYFRYDSACTY